MGNSAQDCGQALTEAGACAVGANCGSLDPFQMAEVVSRCEKLHHCLSCPNLMQANRDSLRTGQCLICLHLILQQEYINVYKPEPV